MGRLSNVVRRLRRPKRGDEWRRAGCIHHRVMLSGSDPGAEACAAILREAGIDVWVAESVVKWVEDTASITAHCADGKKHQAQLAIISGAPQGERAEALAVVLRRAFVEKFTPRELKRAVQGVLPAAQGTPRRPRRTR